MSDPRPEADEARDDDDLDLSIEELLTLARDYRAGTPDVPRDLARCYATYARAAELGSAEAEYAAALFHMQGGVVPQDLKEGVLRLRRAADGGSLHAKVYLGNLYDLGTHFSKDPEKADVWYRSAARAAGASFDDPRAMAELGCVRFALQLPEEERAPYLRRARAYGYELRMRSAASRVPAAPPPEVTAPALQVEPAPAERAVAQPAVKPKVKSKPKPAPAASPISARSSLGVLAFLACLAGVLFTAGSLSHAARRILATRDGQPLPLFGDRADLLYPAIVAVGALLPSLLLYRFPAIARGLVIAALGFAAGFFLWTRWPLADLRLTQATIAAAVAYALALVAEGRAGRR